MSKKAYAFDSGRDYIEGLNHTIIWWYYLESKGESDE